MGAAESRQLSSELDEAGRGNNGPLPTLKKLFDARQSEEQNRILQELGLNRQQKRPWAKYVKPPESHISLDPAVESQIKVWKKDPESFFSFSVIFNNNDYTFQLYSYLRKVENEAVFFPLRQRIASILVDELWQTYGKKPDKDLIKHIVNLSAQYREPEDCETVRKRWLDMADKGRRFISLAKDLGKGLKTATDVLFLLPKEVPEYMWARLKSKGPERDEMIESLRSRGIIEAAAKCQDVTSQILENARHKMASCRFLNSYPLQEIMMNDEERGPKIAGSNEVNKQPRGQTVFQNVRSTPNGAGTASNGSTTPEPRFIRADLDRSHGGQRGSFKVQGENQTRHSDRCEATDTPDMSPRSPESTAAGSPSAWIFTPINAMNSQPIGRKRPSTQDQVQPSPWKRHRPIGPNTNRGPDLMAAMPLAGDRRTAGEVRGPASRSAPVDPSLAHCLDLHVPAMTSGGPASEDVTSDPDAGQSSVSVAPNALNRCHSLQHSMQNDSISGQARDSRAMSANIVSLRPTTNTVNPLNTLLEASFEASTVTACSNPSIDQQHDPQLLGRGWDMRSPEMAIGLLADVAIQQERSEDTDQGIQLNQSHVSDDIDLEEFLNLDI